MERCGTPPPRSTPSRAESSSPPLPCGSCRLLPDTAAIGSVRHQLGVDGLLAAQTCQRPWLASAGRDCRCHGRQSTRASNASRPPGHPSLAAGFSSAEAKATGRGPRDDPRRVRFRHESAFIGSRALRRRTERLTPRRPRAGVDGMPAILRLVLRTTPPISHGRGHRRAACATDVLDPTDSQPRHHLTWSAARPERSPASSLRNYGDTRA